jgi:hypothetical protein
MEKLVATFTLRKTGQTVTAELETRDKPNKSKIIFVNGHWNKIFGALNFSPKGGGEIYWKTFLGNLKSFLKTANEYFNEYYSVEISEIPIFADGSSLFGGDLNGNERKAKGYEYASKEFSNIIENISQKDKIFLISHSEGAAYSAGIAQYFMKNGITIGESIMISADEGDEFSVEGNYPCYQITAGYMKKDVGFVIDPIVGDHMVNGVSRYGKYISHTEKGISVHGCLVNNNIFNLLRELKQIVVYEEWDKDGKIVFKNKIPASISNHWYQVY